MVHVHADGNKEHRLQIVLPLPVAPQFPRNLTIEICQYATLEETFVDLYQAWESCPLSVEEFRANIYWKVRQEVENDVPFADRVERHQSWADLYLRFKLRFPPHGVIYLEEFQYTADVDGLTEAFGNSI